MLRTGRAFVEQPRRLSDAEKTKGERPTHWYRGFLLMPSLFMYGVSVSVRLCVESVRLRGSLFYTVALVVLLLLFKLSTSLSLSLSLLLH